MHVCRMLPSEVVQVALSWHVLYCAKHSVLSHPMLCCAVQV
jgi:hypothetical protein